MPEKDGNLAVVLTNLALFIQTFCANRGEKPLFLR